MNLNVTFPGNLAQVDAASDLRGVPSSSVFAGILFIVKAVGGIFAYDPASLAVDDGTTVIKPTDKTTIQAGRWIKDYNGLGTGPAGPVGASNNTRATLASLKSAATTDLSSIYDNSLWLWKTDDYSATPAEQIDVTVVKSNSASLSAGAWVRQGPLTMYDVSSVLGSVIRTQRSINAETVSIEQFRDQTVAAGDPTADMAAFTKAIQYANAASGRVTISLPSRTYRLTGTLPVLTASYVNFCGQSQEGSRLLCSGGNTIFRSTGSVNGFSNLQVDYVGPTLNDVFAQAYGDSSGFSLRDMVVYNVGTLVRLGDGTTGAYGTIIAGVRGNGANVACPMIDNKGGAGLFINNTQLFVNGVGNPTIDRTSTMTTVSGRSLFSSIGQSFDTMLVSGSCIFERWWRVLDVRSTGNGKVALNFFIDSTTTCDYIRDDAYHLEAAAGSGGVVGATIGGHFNSWEGRGFYAGGAGVVRGVELSSAKIDFAGQEGILCDGPNVRDISFVNPKVTAADRMNTGKAAMRLAQGTDFQVMGGKIGQDGTFGGLPWKPTLGIDVGADIQRYTITGALADGVTKAWQFAANTTGGQGRIVTNNINADYSGFKSAAPYVLPATTVPWVNTTSQRVQVTIGGGTVTAVILADNSGTPMSTGLLAGTFTIQPGDSIRVDYTAAPTARFYVVP